MSIKPSLASRSLALISVIVTGLSTAQAIARDTEAKEDTGWDATAPGFSVPAEQIDINVTKGTWMSLDVSPDGKSIVFDMLGDIYQMPISGGTAERLLAGHAWEIQPQYSPDGRFIAFTSDRNGADNIWVMELADPENLQQITHESFRLMNNPSWHPSGDYLVAKKHFTTSRSLGTGELWLYPVNTGAALNNAMLSGSVLVKRPSASFQKELGEPVFSSDGSSVFYIQNTTPGNTFIYHEDSNGEVMAIKRYDVVDGSITKVAGGPGGAVRPTPSPDGKHLAFVKRVRAASRLFVKDLESGAQRMLVDDLDPDMQETWAVQGAYPRMDWTPDGQAIVYWASGKIWRVDVESGDKTVIPFEVNDSRLSYPAVQFSVDVAPDTLTTAMPRFATRAPRGDAVVFESLGNLYIKRGDSQPKRLVTDAGDSHDYAPVWSPDAKRIYFLRWHDDALGSIRSVSVRGGKSRLELDQPGHYSDLAIDHNGETLLFRRLSGSSLTNPDWGNKPGIYHMEIGSDDIAFVSARGRAPHFGPDSRIYAIERRSSAVGRGSDDAQSQLISMNSSGEDIRIHATSPLASVMMLSPTGRHVAYRETGRLYVSALPPTGKSVSLSAAKDNSAGGSAFPTERLTPQGGEYIHWSPDGKTISWSIGPEVMSATIDNSLGQSRERTITSIDLSLEQPADQPDGVVAFTNARVITMNAERDVIDAATVVVTNNRITAVGQSGEVSIPDNASVVDLGGKVVLPGYVDAHAHGPYSRDQIIPQNNWSLLAHLALGVTTIHNPSSRAASVFPAAEYQRAGKILGPRIFSTGEIIYGAKSTGFDPIESLDDAKAVVSRLKAQGAISVKNYNQPRRAQRQMVIEAARQAGMLVVAEGGSLYHMDMNLIADGSTGIEHNIPSLKIYDDVIDFWSQTDVGYTPTLTVTYGGLTSEDRFYRDTEVWKHPLLSHFVPPTVLQPRSVRRVTAPEPDFRDDDAAAVAKQLMEKGVVVNTGAHGQREGLATHWEMWSFAEGGMSPMQALATATINPAHYLGMNKDLGSIEVGKLADLQVVDGNPLVNLKDTDKITHVMINGRLYRASDLSEQVTGSREAPNLWWHGKPEYEIR